MKKDTFEQGESQNHKVNHAEPVELPSDFTRHISLESLVTLKLPIIKVLAHVHSTNVIYPLVQNLNDIAPEDLISRLRSEKYISEEKFWDAATRVYVAIENGFVERLQSEGAVFDNEDDTSSFVAKVIAVTPDKLNGFVNELSSSHTGVVGEKSCHVFEYPLPPNLQGLFVQIPVADLQAGLRPLFQKRGYEDLCEVSFIDNESIAGMKIVRGAKRTMSRVRDLEKVKRYRDDQKIKEDLVFLVKSANLLWIKCSSANDAQMYANVISSILLGRDVLGLRKMTDLQVFLNKQLGAVLTRVAQQNGLVRVEVRELKVKLMPRGRFEDSAGHKDPCLTDFFPGWEAIDQKNQITNFKLRLIYDPKGKDYHDIELKLGTVKPGVGLKPELLCSVLTQLNVWKPYTNA